MWPFTKREVESPVEAYREDFANEVDGFAMAEYAVDRQTGSSVFICAKFQMSDSILCAFDVPSPFENSFKLPDSCKELSELTLPVSIILGLLYGKYPASIIAMELLRTHINRGGAEG